MPKKYYDGGGGMISSNNSGRAGMPGESFIKNYPENGGYLPENLDDTIKGIDKQIGLDNAKKTGNLKPKKV